MKTLKFILIFFIAASITSCNDNEPKIIAFEFSAESVSGTYEINNLNANATNTTVTQGATVTISRTRVTSDTFEVDLVLNTNGTFTAKGQYREVSIVTAANGNITEVPKIINIDNSGNYTVNTTNRTINFDATNNNLVNGNFKVNFFNENTLTIEQETVVVDGGITTTKKTTIIFVRK